MAAFLSDDVLDAALQLIIDNADTLHICSSQPANYAGVAAVTLGNKAGPTVGAQQNGDTSGRKVRIAAITDGSVTATGTATHWVLVDDTNSRLLVAQALTSSQAVTSGNQFSLAALDVEIPDAA